MFFLLSKILGFFALPSNTIILLGVLGALLLVTRHSGLGRRLLVASVFLMAVVGFSPLGNIMILPLEQRFPVWDTTRGAPDGIVVLGGSISPEVSFARHTVALNEAAERLTVVAELARRYPDARIVFTGGNARLVFGEGTEGQFARTLLQSFDIAPARISIEDRSRNTVENAEFTKALVAPKPGERWLLVTSAYHMPRAMGIFRRAGFAVEAYPVDYRTRGPADAISPFERASEGIGRTDTAVREWVGLFSYWITGQSSSVFPGPEK